MVSGVSHALSKSQQITRRVDNFSESIEKYADEQYVRSQSVPLPSVAPSNRVYSQLQFQDDNHFSYNVRPSAPLYLQSAHGSATNIHDVMKFNNGHPGLQLRRVQSAPADIITPPLRSADADGLVLAAKVEEKVENLSAAQKNKNKQKNKRHLASAKNKSDHDFLDKEIKKKEEAKRDLDEAREARILMGDTDPATIQAIQKMEAVQKKTYELILHYRAKLDDFLKDKKSTKFEGMEEYILTEREKANFDLINDNIELHNKHFRRIDAYRILVYNGKKPMNQDISVMINKLIKVNEDLNAESVAKIDIDHKIDGYYLALKDAKNRKDIDMINEKIADAAVFSLEKEDKMKELTKRSEELDQQFYEAYADILSPQEPPTSQKSQKKK